MLRSGDVHRDQGDLVKARRAYESAAQMLGTVAGLEPGQRQWRRDLAVARSALADVLLAQADVAGAAMVHTSALDVLQALARAEPADTAIQRDLLVAWAKVGQLRLRQQDRRGRALGARRRRGDRCRRWRHGSRTIASGSAISRWPGSAPATRTARAATWPPP